MQTKNAPLPRTIIVGSGAHAEAALLEVLTAHRLSLEGAARE